MKTQFVAKGGQFSVAIAYVTAYTAVLKTVL